MLTLLKPRGVVVVGGGSLLQRIGSSVKKKQHVLSILSVSSSSSASSLLSLLLSSLYNQSSPSSFPRNTYGLLAFGIVIGSNNNENDKNNNQTTYMAPSSDGSAASFLSVEMIGAAAKIIQHSAPHQCTYAEALEYTGIQRDHALKEVGIINAHHGLLQFKSSKEKFMERYKAIFDSIPLLVSIANKHGRLLKMLGLPDLPPPPVSILVNGKKEFLPSIYIINSKSRKKTASAIGQHLGWKARAWTKKGVDAAAATAISNNNSMGVTTTPSVHLVTKQQEVISPMTVDTTFQSSFSCLSLSTSSSIALPSALVLASTPTSTSKSEPTFKLNSFKPPQFGRTSVLVSSISTSTSVSASKLQPTRVGQSSVLVSSVSKSDLFAPSPLLANLVSSPNATNDNCYDDDLASLEHGQLIEPSSKRHGQKPNSSQLITSLSSKGTKRNTIHQEQAQPQEEERQKSNRILMYKLGLLLWKGSVDGETDLERFDSADKCAGLINRLFKLQAVSGYQLSNAVNEKRAGKSPPERGRPSILSSTVFDLLCRLFFSRDSVNQANRNNYNERNQNISLLDRIVNEHRKQNGDKEIDAVHLYKSILHANSLKQQQAVPDTRESNRHLWLTFCNQNLNHEKWEDATVCLGILRPPVNDEEK